MIYCATRCQGGVRCSLATVLPERPLTSCTLTRPYQTCYSLAVVLWQLDNAQEYMRAYSQRGYNRQRVAKVFRCLLVKVVSLVTSGCVT